MLHTQPLLVITGPTASGKTRRAVAVARNLDGEIISADSRQVYQGMDIGTGKDMEEYGVIQSHLIDICPAGYKYNLYEYLRDFNTTLADIRRRGKTPIICGGTGLYIESALKGLSLPQVPENKELRDRLARLSLPELTQMLASMKRMHNTTDVDTAQRAIRAIEIEQFYLDHPEQAQTALNPSPINNYLLIGIDIPREERRRRILSRLNSRLEQQDMVGEVRRLLDAGIPAENLIYYGLEYKFITLYLTRQLTYEQMKEQLFIAICQFAKRQMTWFRGMERRGFSIWWLPYDMPEEEFVNQVAEKYHSLPCD